MTAAVEWVGLRNGVLVSRFASQVIAERALKNRWVDSIAPDDWAARAAARRCQERADLLSLKQQQIAQRQRKAA
jgi:hypothetical protein